MNGLMPISVMMRPLMMPTSTPTRRPSSIATGTGTPLLRNIAVTIPESARFEPTERSNAPATRRTVIPTAIMLWSDSDRSTAETLLLLMNSGAAKESPMMPRTMM